MIDGPPPVPHAPAASDEAALPEPSLHEPLLRALIALRAGRKLDASETVATADFIENNLGETDRLMYRDELYRDLAERRFPGRSKNGQAKAIEEECRRYRAGAWKRQRDQNTSSSELWQIFRIDDQLLSVRQLRHILRD